MEWSVFDPASPQAAQLLWLWDASMWVCGFLLTVVTGSIVYILVKYRQRPGHQPSETAGNRKLEITWTAGPIALVALLFALSVLTAREVDPPIRRAPDVIVIGHQWWWEVQYPGAKAVTANEVHLPVGRDMLIAVESADVIHDFWAPRLGRKMDAIPGLRNFIWIRAEKAGTYLGACAEYCGAQHAWMRFRVIAQQPAAYEAWLKAQAQPAASPSNAEAMQGEMLFKDLTCANCHNVKGVNQQKQYGPDLTHVASRTMLAGERLVNTPSNLREWLHEPNVIKPGCYMPNLKLSGNNLTVLTAYLENLR